jgi:uncharacterized membrane protein YeaQ/YmgE (transglycosylase-associated protein family)
LLGIVGAILGGWIFRFFGLPAGSWFWGLLAAIIGAVILLLIWGAIARSSKKA